MVTTASGCCDISLWYSYLLYN